MSLLHLVDHFWFVGKSTQNINTNNKNGQIRFYTSWYVVIKTQWQDTRKQFEHPKLNIINIVLYLTISNLLYVMFLNNEYIKRL